MSEPRLGQMAADWRKRFKDHQAFSAIIDPVVHRLAWFKPGTGIDRIDYLIVPKSGVLHVQGDLGFASYWWHGNRDLGLAFLAGCAFDYFMEKCQSSEEGRRPRDWDRKEAKRNICQAWAGLCLQANILDTKLGEVLRFISEECESREHWQAWVAINILHQEDLDGEDCASLWAVGEVPHSLSVAHWLGLKMAWEQLKPTEAPAPASVTPTPAPTADQ